MMVNSIKGKYIAILTQYFYPDLPGTAKIAKDLALGLAKYGCIVNVYTGTPAYSVAKDTSNQLLTDEIRVRRSYSPNLSRSGNFRRLLNTFLVAVSISFRLFWEKNNIIIVDSTSPFLLAIAPLVRLVKKTPYIVIVHDVYPDIAIKLGVIPKHSILASIWRTIYKIVYRLSSKIVVLGPNMSEIVSKDFDEKTKDKIIVIPNWADESIIKPSSRYKEQLKKQFGFENLFIVIYSGNMGLTHDIETILKSANKLIKNRELLFLLIGGGGQYDASVKFISDKGLGNVKILPYQPEDVFPKYLACSDVSLVTLAQGMQGLSVPSKIYSSLAAGLPIIGILDGVSEVANIISEGECGYVCEPGDVDTLVDSIQSLYCDEPKVEKMSANARREFEKKYSREIGVNKHVDLVKSVLNENI